MTDEKTIDRLQTALDEIELAAAENVERSLEIQRRVSWFRSQLDAGHPIVEIAEAEHEPRVVELITTNMATLETVGAQFRAALALALRAEGLTIQAIGEMFGVSRQRISALLRQRAANEVLEPTAP